MPSYAKFLNEIVYKRKLEEHETVALTEECSVAIQNTLPVELKDSSSFFIPCLIENVCIAHALCNLGSNVSLMLLCMCENHNLREMRPTTISLQLADHFVKYPFGVLEVVSIKVGDLYAPVDFLILE